MRTERKRLRYYTGLLPMKEEQMAVPVRGRGWEARIERMSERWRSEHSPDRDLEIVLYARNQQAAQAALDLIIASYDLLAGEPQFWGGDYIALPEQADGLESVGVSATKSAGYPRACRLAAKASTRQELSFGVALYRLSQKLHANLLMDLHPGEYPHRHRSPSSFDQARFAYAIVTAYAVVEQLDMGMEPKKQSFANKCWVPARRQELEQRLQKKGVDITEPLLWHLRGGKTKLEKHENRKTAIVRKAKWSSGRVRDCLVDVVDAVADVRFLRSYASAHKASELTGLLSVYDVANAQRLAQRFLLDRLRFSPVNCYTV
ncbi:MAG TPA: hypothetical protein VK395_23350 [Gemmataceae bacterium]|nr:hypothetical protein [Gemmataceae bacterium]